MLDVVRQAGAWVHLFVMTSDKNHDMTVAFFYPLVRAVLLYYFCPRHTSIVHRCTYKTRVCNSLKYIIHSKDINPLCNP